MSRRNVEFTSSDGVKLRGWFYPPNKNEKAPCVVMAHGFSAVKEMDLDLFSEYFRDNGGYACLAFDNRNFGESDGTPRYEIIPSLQISDYSDAITYAQTLPEVNPDKIAVWGSSYSGGHVLHLGATDRRIKAVLSQVPLVSGWHNFHRLIRPDFIDGLNKTFQEDRIKRMKGEEPGYLPVVDENPMAPSALPTADSYEFFIRVGQNGTKTWKNTVTVKSIECFRAYEPAACIENISPTPLLMTVAGNDCLTPTVLALEAYSRAREPKQLNILPGGHFEAYKGPNFEGSASAQLKFLQKYLPA